MKKILKKYTFEFGTVFLIILIGLIFFIAFSPSNSASETQKGNGKIELNSVAPVDLGNIPIRGGKISTKFSFRNTGTGMLSIRSGQTSCMCTVATIQKNGVDVSPDITMPGHGAIGPTKLDITLASNEEAELVAVFDPMAHGPNAIGPIKRDITLTTDSIQTPEVRFSFFGTVQ